MLSMPDLTDGSTLIEAYDPPLEACDLLAAGMCSARCLLAMETPPGWPGCTCVCGGRYHAALIGAPVHALTDRS